MHLFSIQKRPKKPPRRPTALPKRFKTRSRRPQDAPRRAQAAPQTPQDAPKTPQDRPKRRAKRPKTPQDAGTKRVPKAIRSAIPSRPRFWSVLGWILGSFWMDFGSFWNSLWRLPQEARKTTQSVAQSLPDLDFGAFWDGFWAVFGWILEVSGIDYGGCWVDFLEN